MVVDACFIASQIDVWTQAYNGPTSRRKYVLNLLNVLHKNVTEEYKTDQFLHVIYWFLIYKSNLGHFFRNEGIFPPPTSSSSSSSTNYSMYRPRLLVRCLQALPPPGRACVPTCVHALTQLPACVLSLFWEAADLGWKGWSHLCSICVTSSIGSWKPERRAAERTPRAHGISQILCPGLLPKWPIFSGPITD